MARETSKAAVRRLKSFDLYAKVFAGNGIDIGCGNDPLSDQMHLWPYLLSVYGWDWPDGDAQEMPGLDPETFSFVYSSHTLEHVRDPRATLERWWQLIRPGGYLLVQVPDEDTYEQGVWPSTWNPDHKSTFAVGKGSSWSPVSHNVDVLGTALPGASVIHCIRLTEHFRPDWPRQDQTQGPAECAIELLAQKTL